MKIILCEFNIIALQYKEIKEQKEVKYAYQEYNNKNTASLHSQISRGKISKVKTFIFVRTPSQVTPFIYFILQVVV